MCGIAGYVGPRNAVEVVFDQLKRLEYRGYDSAGIAYFKDDSIQIIKRAGKLKELNSLVLNCPKAEIAIAHSRWATHGAPTDLNAHPHVDQFGQITLIHNGIIENYLELKEELIQDGHTFQSETDTEVAAHIIGKEYQQGATLEEAVRKSVKRLRGAYALVVMSKREPEKIVTARNASPIVIGVGEGEHLLASDIPALLPYTRDVVILEDNRIAVLHQDRLKIFDLDGAEQPLKILRIEWDIAAAEKGGFEHFMLKEIHEQPEVVRQCLAGRIDEKNRVHFEQVFSEHVWAGIERVCIVACGTGYNAGLMGKAIFEELLRLPVDVHTASEFRYSDPILSSKTLAIFISQSGETADTLAALRLCKERRIRTLGIVNVMGSSIARECDRTLFTQAGPEISVASTKAYTAQVLVLLLLSLYVAQVRETPGVRVEEYVLQLRHFSEKLENVLKLEPEIIEVAKKIKDAPLFFYTGRGIDAYAALEGALKVKEIAYVQTQECSAGELKHGPLALIEPGVVAVVGAIARSTREKLISNIKEIQARGGTVVAIAGDKEGLLGRIAEKFISVDGTGYAYLDILSSVVVMQLLAYHIACLKGIKEIDQPRNLAKSVTVE